MGQFAVNVVTFGRERIVQRAGGDQVVNRFHPRLHCLDAGLGAGDGVTGVGQVFGDTGSGFFDLQLRPGRVEQRLQFFLLGLEEFDLLSHIGLAGLEAFDLGIERCDVAVEGVQAFLGGGLALQGAGGQVFASEAHGLAGLLLCLVNGFLRLAALGLQRAPRGRNFHQAVADLSQAGL